MSYRKRVKLMKGVHLNLSGSGVGVGFNLLPGVSFSMNKSGVYNNLSLPGTGLYKRTKLSSFPDNTYEDCSSLIESEQSYRVEMEVEEDGNVKTTIRTKDGEIITDEEDLRRIKRRPDVKDTISRIQYLMKEKIDETNSGFIEVYKHTEHPLLENTVRAKAAKLKYEPESPVQYDVEEPDELTVRVRLEKEANATISSFFFWTNKKKRREYVNSNLQSVLAQEQDEWRKRKASFEQKELERIAGINDKLKAEYEVQKEAYETYFNGDDVAVSAQMEKSLSSLELPCEFSVDYDLYVNDGLAKLDIDLPEIEDMPSKKASILANGKVSVKDKTKKEMAENYATCVTGLAFFFSGMLFNISSKINTIEVSGYTQRVDGKTGNTTDQYIYAVRFDRETFRSLKFHNIVPYESFELFPHVMDMTKQMAFKTIEPNLS